MLELQYILYCINSVLNEKKSNNFYAILTYSWRRDNCGYYIRQFNRNNDNEDKNKKRAINALRKAVLI